MTDNDTPTRWELRVNLPSGTTLNLRGLFDLMRNSKANDEVQGVLEAMLDALRHTGYDAELDIYRETVVRSGDTPR